VGGAPTQPERDAQRVSLRLGQLLPELEERSAQLLGRGERELHVRLDPDRPGDSKSAGRSGALEQRGLADARLASHHQYASLPGANAIQQPVEDLALACPTE
jgi:hypothetical protein